MNRAVTRRLSLALAVVGLVALNVAVYRLLSTEPAQELLVSLEAWRAPGAFLLAFVANVTVLLPIPYNGIVFALLQTAPSPWVLALAAAAGSTLGEVTGYAAGRAGKEQVGRTRAGAWVQRQMANPWRGTAVVVALATPPNPAFDVAGLAAGSTGVPLPRFLLAVLVGRAARFLTFAYVGAWLLE